MSRVSSLFLLIVSLFMILNSPQAGAEWTARGLSITTMTGNQYIPSAIEDGSGGAIVIWYDERSSNLDIYCQRITAEGNTVWAADGVPICNLSSAIASPRIASDGAGGAIIAWQDNRAAKLGIYSQRIDADGDVLWTVNGVTVTDTTYYNSETIIVPDGNGGAILVFNRYEMGLHQLAASRINSDGSIVWGGQIGNPLFTTTGIPGFYQAIPDGNKGVIVVWEDDRSGNQDIYAMRVDSLGSMVWTANGLAIASGPQDQTRPQLVADGAGGAIFAWIYYSFTSTDIQAIRINADGNVNNHWPSTGQVVCDQGDNQLTPIMIADGAGGAIIAWDDWRTGGGLYAQRLDARGNPLWPDNGIMVAPDSLIQTPYTIVTDGDNGAIMSWRSNSGYLMLTAQRIDRFGTIKWNPNGMKVVEDTGGLNSLYPVPTTNSGAIIFYQRAHLNCDVSAQRIDRFGYWGFPNPSLLEVADIPADQGGRVLLTWASSYLDQDPYTVVTHYSVWRKLDMQTAAELVAGGVQSAHLADIDAGFRGRAYLLSPEGAAGGWEWLNNQTAMYLGEYSYSAFTLNDSIDGHPGTHEFMVAAHTAEPFVAWSSESMLGYSVDNLAPPVTQGFAGVQQESPPGLVLSWQENPAGDLRQYQLYRGDTESFVPGPSNRIVTTTGSSYTDETWTPGGGHYYKLAAEDAHGNIGLPAVLLPEDVLLETLLSRFSAAFDREAIVVTWTLAEAGQDMQFTIWRRSSPGSGYLQMEQLDLVSEETTFSFTDRSVAAGRSYQYRVFVNDEQGSRLLLETDPIAVPARTLSLYQNHPNPFNPVTTIRFSLPEKTRVGLDIFDTSGRLVRRLLGEVKREGLHTAVWTGTDEQGQPVSSGVYFYRLTADRKTLSRKMILLR